MADPGRSEPPPCSPERPERGPRSRHPLADWLFRDQLDPAYHAAARRRGGAPARGPAQRVWLVTGTSLVGLLLGIAAANAAALAPGADRTTRGLAGEVVQARERTSALGARAEELAAQVDGARDAALAGDAAGSRVLEQVAALRMADAATPVHGPGLRITVADPPAPEPTASRERTVLDRDLRLLVNALWSAGAEAVSLGGVRLHPRATIRQAGGAMLVDNRPVGQPYRFEAIGDQEGLQINLLNTDGYGRFSTFTQIYRTEFRIEPVDDLTLPAAHPGIRLAVPAAPPPVEGGGR